MSLSTLRKIYTSLDNPSYLGTAKKLRRALTTKTPLYLPKHKRVPLKKIQLWLQSQEAHSLHKPVIKNFKRNHYFVYGIDHLWECDLCDLSMYKKQNDGYSYLFTVIDVFSKYAWVKPIKKKTARSIIKVFHEILTESKRKPSVLQSDRGLEFKNKNFKSFLEHKNIKLQFPQTTSQFKCAVIERFNRTIKQKMFKYFTEKGKNHRRYIDDLQKLVFQYNHSFHSTIKMEPAEVKPHHSPKIYTNTHKSHQLETVHPPKFAKKDQVRVIKKKNRFEHGYTEKWTREIFVIHRVIYKKPYPLYQICDQNNVLINGKFYEYELQKVSKHK